MVIPRASPWNLAAQKRFSCGLQFRSVLCRPWLSSRDAASMLLRLIEHEQGEVVLLPTKSNPVSEARPAVRGTVSGTRTFPKWRKCHEAGHGKGSCGRRSFHGLRDKAGASWFAELGTFRTVITAPDIQIQVDKQNRIAPRSFDPEELTGAYGSLARCFRLASP